MGFEQEIIEGYSISPQQLAAWRSALGHGFHIYTTDISLLLTAEVSPERINEALQRVIIRHEILRSTFPTAEEIGVPLQVVSDQPILEWECQNAITSGRLQGIAHDGQEIEQIPSSLAHFRNRAQGRIAPDSSQQPAVCAVFVRFGGNRSRLFVSTSALATDAGSALVIAKELASELTALDEGNDNQAEVPQYAQYSEYIQQWREGEESNQAAVWWQDHDARSIPPILLPFLRSTAGAAQLGSIPISMPEEMLARLDRLAREMKLSLEALMSACWAMILMRVSGRRDGAVCIETSGRTFEEVERMPGLFSRSLPVSFSISESDSFVDLWRSIDGVMDGVRENEDGAPNLDEHSALRCSWLDASEAFQIGPIRIEVEDVFSCTSPFDLRFACVRTPTMLRARLDFNARAVSQADATLLAGYIENAIAHIAENLQERAGKINLLSPDTRRLLTHDWNRTQRAMLDSRPFPAVFRERAEQHASRIALRQGNRELTFESLRRLVDAYSHKLRGRNVGPESVVAITADPCIEATIGLLAVLQAGGAFLPVDATHAKERLEWILKQAAVTTVLCRPGEETDFPAGPWTPIAIDTQDHAAIPSDAIPSPCHQQNAAYVIYTSGSTGQPKGVVISHESLSNYLDWCVREYAGDGSCCALHSSLAFDLSITSLLAPLLLGELVYLPDSEQRADYLPSLLKEHERYLWIKLTPSHARVAPRQVSSKAALGCAGKLILGGESLASRDLLEWVKIAPDAEMINEYGPTEATVGCAVYRTAASMLQDGPVPIGRPIANATMYVLDEELEPCPVGAPGEIYISGDCLARGYLYRPDLTAERFLPNPHSERPGMRMYRTGDIGRYRSDGCIEYLGRTDDQVKIHGYRIELGEIEAVLVQHPMIREAVVLAKDEDEDSRLIAYFTRADGAGRDLPLSELREFLSSKLPPYMIPHTYIPIEALPLNSNGKIDRAALKRYELSAAAGPGGYSGPRTFEEEILATIWAKILGMDRVSVDADYFLLGGDSIRAIQIAGAAAEAGLNVTLNMIFRHRTIRKLASALTSQAVQALPSTAPFSLISEEDRLRLPEDAEDAYGLSRLQAGMVFERQYHPGAAIYHDIFSHHVRIPLDQAKLEQAVAEFVRRHPMLRTSFHIEGFSEPLQIVHRAAETPITFEDMRELSREEQREAVARWIEEEKRRGFDYSSPPLLRFRAHKTGPDNFYFSLSFHHAILDGWSDATMLVELGLSYYRLLAGKPTGLESPATLYRDFIGAERAATSSAEHREYWLNLLRGCTPTTIPRWAKVGDDGNRSVRMQRVPIGQDRSRSLNNLARELAVPLKSVLLAAHLRVMGLVGGTSDVVTTISSAGRLETADGHRVIGLHLNSTPLRLNLGGGRWVDIARAAFEAEKDALPWRRYPLADIQRDMGLRRLSETSFYYTHYHLLENLSELPGFEILDQLAYEETSFALVANFDLNPRTLEISLDLAYDQTELTIEQVQSIAGYYERALASMASDPLVIYSSVSLLSDAERFRILDYAGASTSATAPGSVIAIFEDCVRRAPGAQAVVCGESAISYEQLNRRSNQLARCLRHYGAGPDVRIALLLDRSVEMIIAIIAALKAGAAYLPIEPGQPDDRINAILADSNPCAIVTTNDHIRRLSAPSHPAIALDSCDTSIQEDPGRKEPDWNLADPTTPDNLAYIIYTSGSTGRPKGVLISRGNLLHSTNARLQWYDAPAWRFLLLSPYSFDSSVAGIFWTLCSGGTLVLTPGELHKDPAAIVGLMRAQGITTLLAVPALYANLLESCAGQELTAWKTAIVAGQAFPVEVVRNHHRLFPSVALYNEYGPTETTVWSTAERCSPADDIVPIGKPVPYARAYVLDRQLTAAPVGSPGELFIGGAGVARGYLDLAELTAERFLPDPFSSQPGARMYRTGDRARFLYDGRIEYLGRVDWQIKIRGHRLEPEEIETAIRSVPGVRAAAVAASQQTDGDARLVGYVVTDDKDKDDKQVSSAKFIRAELDRLLPAYMIPSLFVFMDALPVGPNGKLDRRRLPEPIDAKRASAEFVAPRNEVEQILADIWSAVLQVPRVGIRDDFFGLGGDSILSIQVIARARRAGVNITPIQLFHSRTIEALAHICERQTRALLASPNIAADSAGNIVAGQPMVEDLKAEAVLDADIIPESSWPESPWSGETFELNHLFLTGSTGFLGAFLLDALLKYTHSNIYCLVRCDSAEAGAGKIKHTLESFRIWDQGYESRIIAVPGDLSQPLLGLSPDQFHLLAARIDAVYHSGALVNFLHPYSALKPVNVTGTRESLRLACRVKPKPFHYVSTLSVFFSIGDAEVIREEDEPAPPDNNGQRPPDGYAQSKWVAERLVMSARSRGLPVNIYRPGRITGHSTTGVANLNDLSCRFIKGCIQLGAIPDWDGEVNVIPVDYASEAIVHLSLQKEASGKIFHLSHSGPAHWSNVVAWIESYGYPIRRVPYGQWLNGIERCPDNALYSLLPTFPPEGFEDYMAIPEVSSQRRVEFDCQNTLGGLANTSLVCPLIDSSLISSYLSHFVDKGFLPSTKSKGKGS